MVSHLSLRLLTRTLEYRMGISNSLTSNQDLSNYIKIPAVVELQNYSKPLYADQSLPQKPESWD